MNTDTLQDYRPICLPRPKRRREVLQPWLVGALRVACLAVLFGLYVYPHAAVALGAGRGGLLVACWLASVLIAFSAGRAEERERLQLPRVERAEDRQQLCMEVQP